MSTILLVYLSAIIKTRARSARSSVRRAPFGLWSAILCRLSYVPLGEKQLEMSSTHLCNAVIPWITHLMGICVTIHKASQKMSLVIQYDSIVRRLFAEVPKNSSLNLRETAKLQKKKGYRKITWKISDYSIRWWWWDMPRNRIIIGVLIVGSCFLCSMCLIRAGNSEGAHVVLHKLQVWEA